MKISTTRFRANSAMHRKGKGKGDEDRPEQLLIAEVIEHHLSPNVKVLTEEVINYVTESHQSTFAKIDVYVVWQSPEDSQPGEYLLRVMGQYHDTKKQRLHDDLQRSYLMRLHPPLRRIITVCDLWYHLMPTTFKRNKRKLNKDEALQAYDEISKQAYMFNLPEKPFGSWLETSVHIK
jgi:hypothetical protein